MTIALTLSDYLSRHHINYQVIEHKHTRSSLDSSRAAHVPASKVSKAVILQNREGQYLMASLPVDHRLSLAQLNQQTNQEYHLVSETLLKDLFPDCAQGAIPSVGDAYKMKMLVDDSLLSSDFVYIEAGDHQTLIKISKNQYLDMMSDIPHADICGRSVGLKRSQLN